MSDSILDDPQALAALKMTGFGVLVLDPSAGATADDEKIERMVIRMVEHFRDFGVDDAANYPELVCAAIEFAARVAAAPLSLNAAPRSQQRSLADGLAKSLRTRILGACRYEGSGQERHDN